MNKSVYNGAIILLVFIVVVLSLLLFQGYKTINEQRAIISDQQKKISQLESEVEKLSAVTPDKIINDAKSLLRDQGASFLNNFIERVQE